MRAAAAMLATAAVYTIVETPKMNGLDPEVYLADVLARIADHPANRGRRAAALELAGRAVAVDARTSCRPDARRPPAGDDLMPAHDHPPARSYRLGSVNQ